MYIEPEDLPNSERTPASFKYICVVDERPSSTLTFDVYIGPLDGNGILTLFN
jgi:hypothetical protein